MPNATDILPITGFTRDYQRVRRDLQRHGRPTVLTIDGSPALVIQDAAAYDRMIELMVALYVDAAAARGLADDRARLSVPQLRARQQRRKLGT